MIPYPVLALLAISTLAMVHLIAAQTRKLHTVSHGRFLSAGGGVAIAYVFVDLLPKLSESDPIVSKALAGLFPYFERHVYVIALTGFLLFFTVDRTQSLLKGNISFWLSLASYSLFNFLVGYAVADKNNPETQPLLLFTFAMGLHYFTNDFSLNKAHGQIYGHIGKWILIAALFLGGLVGIMTTLSVAAVAMVSAFIGGGVIMNVTRHELPDDNPHSLGAFLIAAAVYTMLLLAIGA